MIDIEDKRRIPIRERFQSIALEQLELTTCSYPSGYNILPALMHATSVTKTLTVLDVCGCTRYDQHTTLPVKGFVAACKALRELSLPLSLCLTTRAVTRAKTLQKSDKKAYHSVIRSVVVPPPMPPRMDEVDQSLKRRDKKDTQRQPDFCTLRSVSPLTVRSWAARHSNSKHVVVGS